RCQAQHLVRHRPAGLSRCLDRFVLLFRKEPFPDMKLFVIGANGRTGTEIVDLARTRGHQVTAFVRSPEKLAHAVAQRADASGSLTIVRGDPLRPDSIAAALPGHDAVLSAIG